MRYLRLGKKTLVGLLTVGVASTAVVLVVLASMASATITYQAPASGTYGITPELVANGGQNNDCSFFYPGSIVSSDGTVTLPSGQVLHQFYINNPKNTTSATDPTTGAKFSLVVDAKTNQVTSVNSTGAAIVDIGIKGGVNTTRYNYSGAIPQPSPPAAGFTGFPGTVTGDTLLHPPNNGTDKNGNPIFYTVSHTSFCYTTGSTASGTVFSDANHDGAYNNPPDSGLVATVDLYKNGTFVTSTQSDASGFFQFTNLTPGVTTYKVCVVKPASSIQTLPTSSTANNTACSGSGEASKGYSVDSSTTATGLNFGLAPTASISGVAFSDSNGDGLDGLGEPGLNGLTVSLTDTTMNSAPITTTTANNGVTDGAYSFPNVLVGDTYKVCITNPSGTYEQTAPGSGAACTGMNVAGNGYSFTLTSDNGAGRNFGFQPFGKLSGTIYQDMNGPSQAGPDGQFESGTDTVLPGWTVTLYNGSDTQVGQASSDQNGQYSITAPFDTTQTYTACVTPGLTGSWAQTEPLPTAANSCAALSGLPKGQQFQPATGTATVSKNFGVTSSEPETTPCPPQVPFGADQTNGELQIQLAGCKPFQTFTFNTGSLPDGSLWASVFAADQVVTPANPEVPLIEKWTFPDPIKADGTPAFTHVDYTDVFPYDPAAAQELPQCKLDPRDPGDPQGMTLSADVGGVDFTQDANKGLVLPAFNPDGVTPATSCAISTRIYTDANGKTSLEVYAYSDIDSWGKSAG